MAEDGTDDVNGRLLSNRICSHKAGNMVSNFIRKASGIRDELYICEVASGIEKTIDELRAEKEVSEFHNRPSPTHNDQDSPIDFSVKRRTSFSGSLTDDSETSSSSPGHTTDYNTMSPPTDPGIVHDNIDIKRDTPSPDDHRLLGQLEVGNRPVKMPPLLSDLGFFPGLSSNLLTDSSAINAFSKMACVASKDPRNKKNIRPFKAYPKEALQMPLGFYGFPGLAPFANQHGMDLGMLMGMNNDDLVNLYHQQLQLVRDNKLTAQSFKLSTSHLLPSSKSKQNHMHYQQQYLHRNHSPSTISSISSPVVTPDHLNTTTAPRITYQTTTSTPGSLNATLVSSTSSFSLSNSRKRPHTLPDEQKDAAYWERRRKNNDAAKRSRDARRAKEDEIAVRASLLEQENMKLRVEVATLKTETERLRCMLYN